MPAIHKIDDDSKLIVTTWSGVATDQDLIDSLMKYQQDTKNRPDYASYNELVDFSSASSFQLTADGIIKLAKIAARTDVQGVKTKLAIVVNQPLAYGLGRMYEAYRSLVPSVYKDVHVFKNYGDALEWVKNYPG